MKKQHKIGGLVPIDEILKHTVRYSLRRAIHHEYWLQRNIEVDAPELIIEDCKRLRDYWKSKLTKEEIQIMKQWVNIRRRRDKILLSGKEKLDVVPYKGCKRW